MPKSNKSQWLLLLLSFIPEYVDLITRTHKEFRTISPSRRETPINKSREAPIDGSFDPSKGSFEDYVSLSDDHPAVVK